VSRAEASGAQRARGRRRCAGTTEPHPGGGRCRWASPSALDPRPRPPARAAGRGGSRGGAAFPTLAAATATAPRPGTVAFRPGLFRSFFLGGFECSTHRRADGRRLDLIAATRHDQLAGQDYRQLAEHGIRAARDGVRWHLVEAGAPGRYDWSSFLPMLRAAEAAGTQVAWDLCHYGWPDGLDVFSAAFVDRLARYAGAFARLHLEETGRRPWPAR
jgi:hypothetical protein